MFSIEVIGLKRPPVPPKAAILDFDGTISLIRAGWHSLLIRLCTNALQKTPLGQSQHEKDLEQTAKEGIEINIGKKPVYQFYTLVESIRKFGGQPKPPEDYLQEYYQSLFPLVQHCHQQLQTGHDPKEFIVEGTFDLLNMLRRNGLKLYLVSGTEEEFVREDVRLLGMTKYFDGGIYGSQKDTTAFSKAMIIKQIINENKMTGEELIGFGDGHTETRDVKEVGGFAVGVASNETARHGIDSWKREQLLRAGADWIIPDFSRIELVETRIFHV
jgi:phosphoglycolate phosphatase-like HAD superfamily hydrolase